VDRGANPEAVESAAAAEIEHVQRPVGDLAVGVALSAGGERRCKIRENVGNDGHYSPCRLSCAHNVVGRFIAKPPPCPPPAWVARREGLS
jgi:hypothetical protein